MQHRTRCSVVPLLYAGVAFIATAGAQSVPSTQTPAQFAPAPDPLSTLTPEQAESFKVAAGAFAAGKYADALPTLKSLLAVTPPGGPAQALIAKYAAEAALNTGSASYAVSLLVPLEQANPADWQARSLLARTYQETGRKADRDAELVALIALHKASPTTQIGKLNQILLERDSLPNGGSVRIWYSLEPWGPYKTYIYSRIYDANEKQLSIVTLESSDFDQPLFAKEHPELAAKGERRFSMDGYSQGTPTAQGGSTQVHATYGFYDGQPPYDKVRDRILEIARGQDAPMATSNSGASTPK